MKEQLVSSFASKFFMTKPKFFYFNQNLIRDELNSITDLADHILDLEKKLIQRLVCIDQNKFYVHYGYNLLSGFCRFGLLFSKTQTQRLVTQVRRIEPTDNFGKNSDHAELQN